MSPYRVAPAEQPKEKRPVSNQQFALRLFVSAVIAASAAALVLETPWRFVVAGVLVTFSLFAGVAALVRVAI